MREASVVFVDAKNGKIVFKCPHCEKEIKLDLPNGKAFLRIKCWCREIVELKVNQRSGKRKKIETSGFAIVAKKRVFIKTADLSVGGVAFESECDISLKEEVKIYLTLDFLRKEDVDVEIEIKIVSRAGKKYGAEFIDLPDYCQIKKDIHWWTLDVEELAIEK